MVKWLNYESNKEYIDEVLKVYDLGSNVDFFPNEDLGAFIDIKTENWIGSGNIDIKETDEELLVAYIDNIVAEDEGVGYGRKMIECLLFEENVSIIKGEATEESYGFWNRMGAKFGEYIDAVEGWSFTIFKEDYKP